MKKMYMWLFKTIVLSILTGCCSSNVLAGDDEQSSGEVLYSINMPTNPFQQGYYQMMIKQDNENTQMSFANSAEFAAYTASFFSNLNIVYPNALNWNTDFGAFSWDRTGAPFCPVGMYGIIPYVSRGYTEGSADTLYMQRPAQITLPFLPTFGESYQAESQIPIVATLPDYQDVFFSFTDTDFKAAYTDQPNIEAPFSSTMGSQLPCWYNFCCATRCTASVACLGAISALGLVENPSFGYFNLFTWPGSWSLPITYNPLTTIEEEIGISVWAPYVLTDWLWPSYYTVGTGINWFPYSAYSNSPGTSYTSSTPWFLSFSPIIAPGYNGNTDVTGQMVTTVLPQGDLGGNFAGYLDTVNSQGSTATYDGLRVASMNLFQVFAQNMQWFSKNTTNYQGQGVSNYNFSPGQGVFSDAMQLAAIQADFVPNSGSSSNSSGSTSSTPPFYGSYGKGEKLSELSVLLGSGVSYNNGSESTTIPLVAQQPMLSKITTAQFLNVPYMGGINTGFSTLSASTTTVLNTYYNGTIPNSMSGTYVYLPIYFADPGNEDADEIGWNYVSSAESTYLNPLTFNPSNGRMRNFTAELGGTR